MIGLSIGSVIGFVIGASFTLWLGRMAREEREREERSSGPKLMWSDEEGGPDWTPDP